MTSFLDSSKEGAEIMNESAAWLRAAQLVDEGRFAVSRYDLDIPWELWMDMQSRFWAYMPPSRRTAYATYRRNAQAAVLALLWLALDAEAFPYPEPSEAVTP